jgi:hypothetical protein
MTDIKLVKFIQKSKENNISNPIIIKNLLKTGWSKREVDDAFEQYELFEFVSQVRKKGVSEEVIIKRLEEQGWSKGEIYVALGKRYFHVNKEILRKSLKIILLVILVGAIIFVAGFFLAPLKDIFILSNFSFGGHKINSTEYQDRIGAYYGNISENCGNHKSIITGKIIANSKDFSDAEITSNIGTLVINKLDSLGNYELKINCINDVVLNFEKDRFVPVHKNISLKEGSNELDVFMADMTAFESINISKNFSIQQDGVSMEIPASSLIRVSDGMPADSAKVSLTSFDATSPEDMQFFPGELEGINENGIVLPLESFGFFKIEVEDNSGNALELKENSSIGVRFPIAESQKDEAPKTIPFWHFNETLGIWQEIGEAKKECSGENCYYITDMDMIGSWFSFNLPAEDTLTSQLTESPKIPGKVKILIPSGQNANLGELTTDMICESGGYGGKSIVKNYNQEIKLPSSEDNVGGVAILSRQDTINYLGKGVINYEDGKTKQVVLDENGNVIKERETECICQVRDTFYNRNFYFSPYFDSSTGFSCDQSAEVEPICCPCSSDTSIMGGGYWYKGYGLNDKEIPNFLLNPTELITTGEHEQYGISKLGDQYFTKICNREYLNWAGLVETIRGVEESYEQEHGYYPSATDLSRAIFYRFYNSYISDSKFINFGGYQWMYGQEYSDKIKNISEHLKVPEFGVGYIGLSQECLVKKVYIGERLISFSHAVQVISSYFPVVMTNFDKSPFGGKPNYQNIAGNHVGNYLWQDIFWSGSNTRLSEILSKNEAKLRERIINGGGIYSFDQEYLSSFDTGNTAGDTQKFLNDSAKAKEHEKACKLLCPGG